MSSAKFLDLGRNMYQYFTRRLLQAIPTLLGITILAFLVMQAAPGDPIQIITFNPQASPEAAEKLRRQLGLDQPPLIQYLYWLIGNDWTTVDLDGDGAGDVQGSRMGFLRGDLGNSIQHRRPVWDLILERIPATLQLTVMALIVGYVIGIGLGVRAAAGHRGWFDRISRIISVIGNAVPGFWLALLLILIFSVHLRWLPMGGRTDVANISGNTTFFDSIPFMIMPVTVLSLGTIASVSRFVRAEVLEVLSQDYIRTAYAKGLSNRSVWGRHALKNALLPVATFIGPALGGLLGGAVIIEQVFSWPGMGRLVVNAVFQRDYPVIMGSVVFGAILYLMGLIISDILYAVLDPRIKLR